jgi:hypothetical protein
MNDNFSINDIYDKNINFLIGSGASFGLFPTLALEIKGENGEELTIESLATLFEKRKDNNSLTLLFMHYYKECIEPVMVFDLDSAKINGDKKIVIENYESFIKTIIVLLQHRQKDKKCNIFTSNYDGCFVQVADELLQLGNEDFVVNDGARGFNKRYLQAKNFNSIIGQTGIFDRHFTEIPQINLIHVHGSAYWYDEENNIRINYSDKNNDRLIEEALFKKSGSFSDVLKDSTKNIADLPTIKLDDDEINQFWAVYNKLPIVNPTKWKFHETVFEEHYYQMLRLLSYELEKPNSIFITFGFSFADEHILNLVKRSLSNPLLQVFVCCFNETEFNKLQTCFRIYKNVQCITVDGFLDFTAFNKEIFTLNPPTPPVVQAPVAPVVQAPVAPVVQAPIAPVVQAPITPVVQAPVAPVVQAPVASVVQAPTTPVVQAPITPVAPTVHPLVAPIAGVSDDN